MTIKTLIAKDVANDIVNEIFIALDNSSFLSNHKKAYWELKNIYKQEIKNTIEQELLPLTILLEE